MAKTNHQRVGEGLEFLSQGLAPFVKQEMEPVHGVDWLKKLSRQITGKDKARVSGADVGLLLNIMWDQWNGVLSKTLGSNERNIVRELQNVRNSWAHNETFSTDDAYRALDSICRILQAVSAPQAAEADKARMEIMRVKFEEQARNERRKSAAESLEGVEVAGIPAWRDVIVPHPDVASGRYQQAEFAADLAQVHRKGATDEYQDPTEFFRRTYLTEGLAQLLSQAVQRLSSNGGVPIVDLQTNFGGGKTHSLLALYHLFSGKKAGEMPGVEEILHSAGVDDLPKKVNRVVLVGTAISPGQIHKKDDGCKVATLWGELAWQLGKKDGYNIVKSADETATNPGEGLVKLFKEYAPCLILIDEWVAYARQLYGKDELPAGNFDTHFTFAQALCEAARAVPGVLLVISIPASEPSRDKKDAEGVTDIEIGGEGGRAALDRLKNVIRRMESPWRPASAEESFEIVRRRLFEPMEARNQAKRDAVARTFYDFYTQNLKEFPADCRDGIYEKRIKAAYPIHPELFDRLYEDWSSLERFQRTRGVLRLMAAVIHNLWIQNDRSPLIMPCSIPMSDRQVAYELTQYLDDHWVPVLESDIDGAQALPNRLDKENPNFGRYSACRRVARTVYIGSAPTLRTANRGIDDRNIKLGCVFPSESPAIFGDALRRLSDQATHLYTDGGRYWYSTQTNVTRTAKEKAEHYREDQVHDEIVRRLKSDSRRRGEFCSVHVSPDTSADVPDDAEARLVILGPEHWNSGKTHEGKAFATATDMLENRGTSARQYRNMLVFLAADKSRYEALEPAVRDYLAWKEVDEQKEQLNLDAHQSKQAETKRKQADDAVEQRIKEAWIWLIIPTQEPQGALEWKTIRVQGDDALAARASKKLESEEDLLPNIAASVLRLHVDRVPLWRGEHVGLRQLWENLAQYLYLPRIKNSDVFLSAVQQGITMPTWNIDGFAYAESFDEAQGRYVGLRVGSDTGSIAITNASVLVKPEAAQRQLAKESGSSDNIDDEITDTQKPDKDKKPPKPKDESVRRFHAVKSVAPQRLARDVSDIAESIVQHLSKHVGAKVEVTVEITASLDEGFPAKDVRTVTENCATLKFQSHAFEKE